MDPGGEGEPVDLGIPGYEDAVEVGRGGFAVVYRAWQPSFDRHVAIKVVSGHLDARAMSRFERECLAVGALSEHPNIVTVYELGSTADGKPFIVMEFLTGGSLGDRIARTGPLGWQQATEVAIKVAGALESAHRAGVLHRDIKPENVLVSRYSEVKLGDFGIARIQGHSETMTGGITASWSHAAPEIVDGHRPTVASDVYSLSSMLYTTLAGRPAFNRPEDEGLIPVLARIATEPVPDLRPEGVPDGLCRVFEQGMAKDPAHRPPSAAAIARLLQEFQAQAGVPVTTLPLEIVDPARQVDVHLTGILAGESGDDAQVPPRMAPALPAAADRPPAGGPPPRRGRNRNRLALLVPCVIAVVALVAVLLARIDRSPTVPVAATGSTSTSTSSTSTSSSTTAPTTGPLEGGPPWAGQPLAAGATPAVLLEEWTKSLTRDECPPLAFASLGDGDGGVPRSADFGSMSWAVAWDKAGAPGQLPDGQSSPTAGRSTFGIAGVGGLDPSAPTFDWPHDVAWSDGSSAGYGVEGGGPEDGSITKWLAYVRVAGHDCLYNVWSNLGRNHLEYLLTQLRPVDGHPL